MLREEDHQRSEARRRRVRAPDSRLAHADIVRVEIGPDPRRARRRADRRQGRHRVAAAAAGTSRCTPGYVGFGMLDAAVPGAVFTSPTPDPILAATKAVDGGAGVLHIVKNYTGDVLNFETAAELAAADGIEVRAVVVDDDVAVKDSLYTAGRRGVGGTVLVEKIAGAAAERGDSRSTRSPRSPSGSIANARSMGMALTPVHRAARRRAELHARRGRDRDRHRHPRRARPRADQARAGRRASSIACSTPILEDLPFASGDRVCCSSTAWAARRRSSCTSPTAAPRRCSPSGASTSTRSLVGNYITSLEMQGMSITLLKLDDEMTELWDAPVHTAALRWGR